MPAPEQNLRCGHFLDGGDIDGTQVGAAALGPDGEDGPGGVDGSDAGHRVLHGGAADFEAVGAVLAAPGGGVDDQIHGAGGDHVQDVGVGLGHPGHPAALDPGGLQGVGGAGGGQDLNAHIGHAPGNAHDLALVLVLHGDDDPAAPLGRLHVGPLEGLQQGLGEGLGQAQALAGGLHLRAKAGVHVGQLFKGEHGHLHRVVAGLGVNAGAVS